MAHFRDELYDSDLEDFGCLTDDTEPLENHFPMEEIVVEKASKGQNAAQIGFTEPEQPELSRPTTEIASEDEYMRQLSELLANGEEREFVRRLSQRCPANASQSVGGLTLLERAARGGLARGVTALLARAGADPNASTGTMGEGGCAPLALAAREGHWAAVEALLAHAGPALDPDAADARGDSALHHAARAARLDAVLLLLRRGADARRRNLRGDAPFGPAEARALLDRCVTCGGEEREIAFDYRLLAPGPASQPPVGAERPCAEMDFVMRLAESEDTLPLLGHPVVRSFVECKWTHVRTAAYAAFVLKLMYVLLVGALVVCGGLQMYQPPWRYYSYIGACTAVIGFLYLVVFNEWFNICTCLAFVVTIVSALCFSLKDDFIEFLALSVFSASIILVVEYDRLPLFTYSVQLMKCVAKRCVLFLLPFILLILILALGFHFVLIHEMLKRRGTRTNNFESLSISVVKTFLIVANSHSTFFPQSILFYTYLLVLVCCSVILLNILIGLTVSCVQKMNDIAEEIKLLAKARKAYKTEMLHKRLSCSPWLYWVTFCRPVFLFPCSETDRTGRASLKLPDKTHLIVGGRSYTVSKDIFVHAAKIVKEFTSPSGNGIHGTSSRQQLVNLQKEMFLRLQKFDEKIEERFREFETKLGIISHRQSDQLQSSLRNVDEKMESIFALLDRRLASEEVRKPTRQFT